MARARGRVAEMYQLSGRSQKPAHRHAGWALRAQAVAGWKTLQEYVGLEAFRLG